MTNLHTRCSFDSTACICLLAVAAFLLYLPLEIGLTASISPDSLEYTICLDNLFRHGKFGFTLNGVWYPSRYAPWFSLSCLAPAYFLSGGNVLCCTYAILAFALILLFAVWRLGVLSGLGKFAILPPILLLFMPDFVFYSRVVLTEIPYTTIFVVLLLLFMRFVDQQCISCLFCVGIGVLAAWAGLVRVTGFAMIIPFGFVVMMRQAGWKQKMLLLGALSTPIAVALLAGLMYNWVVFDSPFRNGYQFWNAVPLDFPELTFNWKYVGKHLEFYLSQPIIMITLVFLGIPLGMSLLAVLYGESTRYRRFLLLEGFVLLHGFVLVALYIGYFWEDPRFFLPVTFVSVPLFIVAMKEFLSRIAGRKMLLATMMALAALSVSSELTASPMWIGLTEVNPVWLASAQITGAVMPPGCVVVQRGDPNMLDYYGFRNKNLVLIPLSRRFDYLIYMTAPRSIRRFCNPSSCWQYVVQDLVDAGVCGVPFRSTFNEHPEQILKYVSEGKRVFFLQDAFCSKDELYSFKAMIEKLGLVLKQFGVWTVPAVSPNPIRHIYDRILFSESSMDSRSEITAAYYEVVPANG